MLTLTRTVGEVVRVGADIEVLVVTVGRGSARPAVKAPSDVAIERPEVPRIPPPE